MSKHTPGPWFAKADPNSSSRDDWVIGIEGGTIDEVAVCSKRDAALIAASPDLLSVCKELAESATYWSEYDVPLGIVDRLNAAIAKAEGTA